MKKPSVLIIAIFIAVAFFFAGYLYDHGPTKSAGEGGRKILYYHDPMHPAYKSDKPGIAPDCGMKLEPVYADGGPASSGSDGSMGTMPSGTTRISSEKQQVIGLRLGTAERTDSIRRIRTLGRVVVDENRLHRMVAPIEGWVRNIHGGTTGSVVKVDQLLASIDGSNREFLTAEQGLFTALNLLDRYKSIGESEQQLATANYQLQLARANLRALGMSETQMREFERTRKSPNEIEIRSPATGVVLARSIFPNLRFDRGTEFYRIADLSSIWVMADMFENEAQLIRPGSAARVTIPYQKSAFRARVSDDPPQFDSTTRTLKVRLEVENTGLILRPDMFVDVEFPVNLPSTLTVPLDAVLDTGLRKTIFVDRGNGYFEPRQVETGWRNGDRVEILKGLMQGERIVVSGAFLIDSESRMKAAAAGITNAPAKDPVCGMDVDEAKGRASGKIREYGGKTVFFCSDQCISLFDKDPARYAGAGGKGTAISEPHKQGSGANK